MAKGAKKKNPAAVALGRKGRARSRVNLTPEQRTELAQKAAAARWKKKPDGDKGGGYQPFGDKAKQKRAAKKGE